MSQFQIKCRLDHIEQYQGKFMHIVTCPAPDAYSKPNSYKVRADTQLGQIGNEVFLDVQISGSIFKKTYRDKQTGIMKDFYEPNVYFDASLAVPLKKVQQG